jgi:hypothetical protein
VQFVTATRQLVTSSKFRYQGAGTGVFELVYSPFGCRPCFFISWWEEGVERAFHVMFYHFCRFTVALDVQEV